MLWTCPWQPLQISLLEFRPGRCLFGLLVYVLVSVLELEDLTLPITVVIGMWEFLLYTEVARQEFSQSDFRLSALCVRASSEFFTFSSLIIGLCVTHDTICPWAKLFDIEWFLLFSESFTIRTIPLFLYKKKKVRGTGKCFHLPNFETGIHGQCATPEKTELSNHTVSKHSIDWHKLKIIVQTNYKKKQLM